MTRNRSLFQKVDYSETTASKWMNSKEPLWFLMQHQNWGQKKEFVSIFILKKMINWFCRINLTMDIYELVTTLQQWIYIAVQQKLFSFGSI